MIQSDVCIIGAGPAGSICALFLDKFGIPCTLVDKSKFPRDKICGDGISGWVLTILKELDPPILEDLCKQPFLLPSYGIRIVAPNYNILDLPFFNDQINEIPPGFISKRIDFDNYLINKVKEKRQIQLLEGVEIASYVKADEGIELRATNGEMINSRLVIFANGANSKFMKDPGQINKDKKFLMTGLKVYYEGITGFHDKNYVELHFLKDFLPGYLWIFPLTNGLANVGVGLDQKKISKKKINLKERMLWAIDSIPYLKDRFKNARMVSKIQAYNLPLWDGRRKISGDHFMLAGDTASLIDPVTGEGMGHAAISGMYAAVQARRSIENKDFSSGFMQQYDNDIFNRIGKELKISSKIPQFIKYPWLFNLMVNRALNSKILREKLTLAMTDLEVRKKLNDPKLYLKVMIGL
ncbi:MAG: geranylgeranyl reductase family protein [Bacteroidales bacterium]|nr:geranylgeranyl reductase family protein [Bacteroidales bacterium]